VALAEALAQQEARAIEAENVRLRAKELVDEELLRRAEAMQGHEAAAEEAARRRMHLQVEAARRAVAETRAEAQLQFRAEQLATEQAQVEADEFRSQQLALEQAQAEAERLRAQEINDAETIVAARTLAALAEVSRAHHAAEAASQKARDLFEKACQLQAQSDEQRAEVGRLRAKAQERIARRRERAARLLKEGIVEVDIDTSDDEELEDTLEKSAAVRRLEASHIHIRHMKKTGSLEKMRQTHSFVEPDFRSWPAH
jgi:hypothetical protein